MAGLALDAARLAETGVDYPLLEQPQSPLELPQGHLTRFAGLAARTEV